MTESTHARIPTHLRRYIVEQNYSRYTSEDQAVWRFIMRQLKNFLKEHAHQSYVKGLELTGITVDRIPRIENIDEHLNQFGWGAVPVSGFIPPAAFMEFQSIGVLPIASDMRTIDHLLYTPAPDIVHEAAGHAPILSDPEYAAYLLKYGEIARRSIISKEDMDQYEAIRVLSDIKEDPRSSEKEIAIAESRLNEITKALSTVSEAALLSRMNWWTAEYGLIGDMKNPKIFGAGLLSSVGESRLCLSDKVKKIPLSVDCVNFSYDITEPQPQLFVAKDFEQLGEVLEDFAGRLSFRRGGVFGLECAKEAKTVNTVELDSGIQISGVLKNYFLSEGRDAQPVYLQFEGPSQLSLNNAELEGQGVRRHSHGYSTPLGKLRSHNRGLGTYSQDELGRLGLKIGDRACLQFESGVTVEGGLKNWLFKNGRLLLLTWADCKVTLGDKVFFDPAWGEYDMIAGDGVVSVFGGPADREKYGQTEDFANKRVMPRSFSPHEKEVHALFQELRDLRESNSTAPLSRWQKLRQKFLESDRFPWLAGLELVELSHRFGFPADERRELEHRLTSSNAADGLKIAAQKL
jgi:phenylalanine-4-hydroxylase